MITPLVITGPIKEPISLAEAREQVGLGAADTTHDAKLAIYIPAARRFFERHTGRTVHQQTLEWIPDAFPGESFIELPRATPLISASIKYRNSDNVETTWDSANYLADTDSTPGRVVLGYNKSWPSFTAWPVSPIRIRYLAGIATASPEAEADEDIKAVVLLLVTHQFENRGVLGGSSTGDVLPVGLWQWIQDLQIDYEV